MQISKTNEQLTIISRYIMPSIPDIITHHIEYRFFKFRHYIISKSLQVV